MKLALRSGGHSVAGHSVTEGGIVLDVSAMQSLHLDVERRLAWAESGLTAGAYSVAAGAHGLATGFGDSGSVGVGGITLAGGIGYLTRKYGLTIDSLPPTGRTAFSIFFLYGRERFWGSAGHLS